MRLLLVGAEQDLSVLITRSLSKEGFTIDQAETVKHGAEHLVKDRFAAVILDAAAQENRDPKLIRQLKGARDATPLLVLTGRSASERVKSLRNGADDCLAKPFAISELSARIHALLRRFRSATDDTLRVRNLSLNLRSKEIHIKGKYFAFTPRETTILEALLRHPNRLVPKEQLVVQLYGLCDDKSANATEVGVHRLRKRLSDVGADLNIETARGVGYILREHGVA